MDTHEQIDEHGQIDHLSNLPESLLLVILSLLPTDVAARTSVLSHRFHQIWEATHITERCNTHGLNMDSCAVLRRENTSYPVFHLILHTCDEMSADHVASLVRRAHSLGLRHLTINPSDHLKALFNVIFSCCDLYSLYFLGSGFNIDELSLPSRISLTHLKTLSLKFSVTNPDLFNELISGLYSLENLSIELSCDKEFNLTSQTVRKLELDLKTSSKSHMLRLTMPNLELLDFKVKLTVLPNFFGEMPKLREVFICSHLICPGNVPGDILQYMMNVEHLKLDLWEHFREMDPFHMIFDPDEEPPIFPNLKSLDLNMCFYEENVEDLIRLLQNCPVLESLDLIHKGPHISRKSEKKPGFKSRLHRNSDDNYQHTYFGHLNIEENRKQLMEMLTKKITSKRVKIPVKKKNSRKVSKDYL